MEKIAYNKKGERIGRVIYETPLYFVEMDGSENGDCYAYAELENAWFVGEIRDMDDRLEGISIKEPEQKQEPEQEQQNHTGSPPEETTH